MGTRVFAEQKGYQLVSDERDVMVSNCFADDVIRWCNDMNICVEQSNVQPIIQWVFGVNLWRVKDEEQRMLFVLRWS